MLKPGTLTFTVLLALLVSLGPLTTDMYLPSLPAIGADLGVGAADVQLTLSVFLLGFAAGQIIYGPVSDRHGRKPTLISGLLIFACASFACAVAPNIEVLIAARFIQAVGASGPIVLARSVVRDVYDGDRAARELARIGSIMGLVPTVAPTLGGVLHVLFGWQSTFTVMIIVGLCAVAVVKFRLPETLRRRVEEPLSVAAILRGFAVVGAHRGYRANVAIVCMTYGGLFAFISGSSFVLQGFYGIEELFFGIAFGSCALSYVVGTLFASPLVLRYGYARTLGIGCTLTALGGAAMLAGTVAGPGHALEVIIPMMIYMIGVGVGLPQSMAGALLPFPDRAGSASSLMGFTQMSVAAVIGVGVGHAIGAGPWPLAATIAATGIASLVIYLTTKTARTIDEVRA